MSYFVYIVYFCVSYNTIATLQLILICWSSQRRLISYCEVQKLDYCTYLTQILGFKDRAMTQAVCCRPLSRIFVFVPRLANVGFTKDKTALLLSWYCTYPKTKRTRSANIYLLDNTKNKTENCFHIALNFKALIMSRNTVLHGNVLLFATRRVTLSLCTVI